MSSTVTREMRPSTRRGLPGGSSASSMASGAVGIVLLVIGIVAVARAGLGDLTDPAVTVGPFTRTPLFGLIEIALGAVAMATAADRDVRSASTLAVITGVAGIVWLIEPNAFAGLLGMTGATGVLYVLVAVALLVGVAIDSRRRVVT